MIMELFSATLRNLETTFYPEDGGSRSLRNVCTRLHGAISLETDISMQQPRRHH
jgi:hypothetical protein